MVTRISMPCAASRRGVGNLVFAFVGFCLAALGGLASRAREAEFDVTPTTTVMVPMRDSVRLATDIFLPARDGKPSDKKVPAILTRTPYGRTGSDGLGRYYAARGYAVIVQDTRGRYDSEGVWHMLTDDGPDGVDTANWIVAQPWSDGQIGMFGTSYVGGTQHRAGNVELRTSEDRDPGRRDVESRLRQYAQRRRIRVALLELDFFDRWTKRQPASPRSVDRTRTQRNDERPHNYLLNLPLRLGTTPLAYHPRVRRMVGRGNAPRSERRVLGAEQHHRSLRIVSRYPDLSGRRMVRFLGR